MTDAQGALAGLAAFAAMVWLNRRPISWWEDRPRPDRTSTPTHHQTPTQARIIRRGPGRELDRRQP